MARGSYRTLLKTKGFLPYIGSQFLGAFNDNVFKMVLSLLALQLAITGSSEGDQISSLGVSLIGAIFISPFILFSGYAGYLADVYNKRTVLVVTKSLEILAMLLALVILPTGSLSLGLIVLFLMATQSTFFSPAKYGIIPEMLPDKQLSRANGIIEMLTFAAIILGTVLGGILFDVWAESMWRIGAILLFIALLGFALIFRLPEVETSGARKRLSSNPWSEIVHGTQQLIKEDRLRLVVIGISWFWFLGALLQMTLLLLSKESLALDDFHTGLIQTFVAVGIGVGSISAGWLSGDKIELGLVPLGAVGIGLGGVYLAFGVPSYGHTVAALLILGVSGGLFIVPLNASLQKLAARREKGRLIATSNFYNTFGIFLASGILFLMHDGLGMSSAMIIMTFCGVTLLVTAYAVSLMPEVLIRFVLWTITHTIYRIRVTGSVQVPKGGPALIVPNHMSYVDGFLIGGALNRSVRFMLTDSIYRLPGLTWFFRMMGVIPVYSGKRVLETVHLAREALKKGDLVCIFAEGGISRTGNLQAFRRGLEKITENLDVPLIPTHLDGVWGSIFSYDQGRFFLKWPGRIPHPVAVTFGERMSARSTAWEVHQRVSELGAEAFGRRDEVQDFLPRKLLKVSKWNFWRLAMADSTGRELTYGRLLVSALVLIQQLKGRCQGQNMVGILLPASVGGALSNFAVSLMGRISVNLNFTAGAEALDDAISQCGLKVILTSRRFLEKAGLEERKEMVFLEDLLTNLPASLKLKALFQAIFLPPEVLWRMLSEGRFQTPDSPVTIIFSSGSTGNPKGVVLSHKNILSNIEGVTQVFSFDSTDTFMGSLPLFHSFGYTGTFWLPLLKKMRVVYHPNPLDGKTIGRLVRHYRATFLISTSTFLQTYLRTCEADQFASLRYVVAGAEKLRKPVAEAFKEKFNMDILEGYGNTEMAPIVAVNTPDVGAPFGIQRGRKEGSVGKPIPGVAARTIDPASGKTLPLGKVGMLVVKGPNRMRKYLKRPDLTAEAFHGGKDGDWYITGDIAVLDQEGFITIVDRLARFSKIGGEMVPHMKIEDALNEILGGARAIVVSLSDLKKGEILAVLYTHRRLQPEDLWKALSKTTLPKLWIPKKSHFHRVKELPVLANGKADLQAAKKIIVELSK